MHVIYWTAIVVAAAIWYSAPSFCAVCNANFDPRKLHKMYMLNFLLGWTVIGWIALILWAGTGQRKWNRTHE